MNKSLHFLAFLAATERKVSVGWDFKKDCLKGANPAGRGPFLAEMLTYQAVLNNPTGH